MLWVSSVETLKMERVLLFLIFLAASRATSMPEYQCPLDGRVNANKKIEAEGKLQECLFYEYGSNIRPALTLRDKTHVYITIERVVVTQMLNNEDYMSLDVYMSYTWKDFRLVWPPSNFSGLQFVYLKPWQLWTPEIILYDGREETGSVVNYGRALVNYTGHVTWSPQIRAHAFCNGDYSAFPFDTQRCKFSFQRQLYETEYIAMDIVNRDQMNNKICNSLHNEWSVLKCQAYVENVKLGTEKSQSLVMDIEVKRNSRYHQYVIILPSTILALLVLCLYWVPHDANQRFALAGGLLFATLMANILLQNFLPLGIGQVPVVVSYLLYIIVMIIITTIISLTTQNIASVDPNNRTIPEIVKKCVLNSLVCRLTGVYNSDNQTDAPSSSFENTNWKQTTVKTNNNNNNDQNNNKVIDSICKQLELLSKASLSSSSVDNPWIQLSQVVDRLFFYIFFFVFIIVTSVLYAH